MGGQGVHERPYQVVRGEVEDQPERDGDGEGRQRFLEHGEQQEGQTQTLQDTKVRGLVVTTGVDGGRGAVSDGTVPGFRSPGHPVVFPGPLNSSVRCLRAGVLTP